MNEKRPVSLKDEAIKLLVAEAAELFEKDPAAGWRACQKILQLDPTRHEAFFYGAQALFYQRKYRESRSFLLSAPENSRNDPLTRWSLACAEVALGLLEEAVKNARFAMEREPKLRERMLKDKDLEPIWEKLKSEGPDNGMTSSQTPRRRPNDAPRWVREEEKQGKTAPDSAPEKHEKKAGKIERLNSALAKLKKASKPPMMVSASCYQPARLTGATRLPQPPAWAEGGTLTYLCPRCTRRTDYRIGQAPPQQAKGLLERLGRKKTPPPAPIAYIRTADAKLILELLYPYRRALADLPKTIAVDETVFCPHCRTVGTSPYLRVSYQCPKCNRTTAYHVGMTGVKNPAAGPVMPVAMDASEFNATFVELAKLQGKLGEMGREFQLDTTKLCAICRAGRRPGPALTWDLGEGQTKTVSVSTTDLDVLKKFVASVNGLGKAEPEWWDWEADKIAKMFNQ